MHPDLARDHGGNDRLFLSEQAVQPCSVSASCRITGGTRWTGWACKNQIRIRRIILFKGGGSFVTIFEGGALLKLVERE